EHEYVAVAASASVRRRRAEITEADNARERLARAHAGAVGRAESRLAGAERALVAWGEALRDGLTGAVRAALAEATGEDAYHPGPVVGRLFALNQRRFAVEGEHREAAEADFRAALEAGRDEAEAVVAACREALAVAESIPPADGWL